MMSNVGLTMEQLQRFAPSAFATEPWHAVSERYAMVPTSAVIEKMRSEGFMPVSAQQSGTRIPGKQNYTKHAIRFRRVDAQPVVGDIFPELLLVNSHDRTSSYKMSLAMMRLACLNGMVCRTAGLGDGVNVRHSGDIVNEVIEASYRMIEDFEVIQEQVKEWHGKTLTTSQAHAYATAAIALRWDNPNEAPKPESLLLPRRTVDYEKTTTLLGAYNRVQESLIRGRNKYVHVSENGMHTRRRTRAVTGIDQDIRINKALWILTEELAKAV